MNMHVLFISLACSVVVPSLVFGQADETDSATPAMTVTQGGGGEAQVMDTSAEHWVKGAGPVEIKSEYDELQRMLGRLMYTRVTVRWDGVPIGEALAQLRNSIGVPVIPRYNKDEDDSGLNPDFKIYANVMDTPVLDLIEVVVQQASDVQPVTWQIRKGFVEVGTKKRLARKAAMERRLYDVSQLLKQPPSFGVFNKVSSRKDVSDQYDVTKELYDAMSSMIEPGHWYIVPQREGSSSGQAQRSDWRDFDKGFIHPGSHHDARAGQNGETDLPSEIFGPSHEDVWVTVHRFKGRMIVNAPDFIHRQIGGYPKPIPPPGLERQPVAKTPAPGPDAP